MGNTCLPQGGALIPARARLQTCSRPAPAPAPVFVRLEARGAPPCHMKGTSARWAGDPFPEGRRWRAPAPSCQTRLRFQQGAWEPHKGNGMRLSHPGARLLPGLLAHNGTFVSPPPPPKHQDWLAGGRHFRAQRNAPGGEGWAGLHRNGPLHSANPGLGGLKHDSESAPAAILLRVFPSPGPWLESKTSCVGLSASIWPAGWRVDRECPLQCLSL